jgi:CO/xanthine dehydrogenase Mo-binding subunit
MVYSYCQQKMEPIKIKRRARTIPFGFKQSDNPDYIEPVKEELEALEQAKKYLKTCSLRETAQWLHRKTGRYISHVGLKKRVERGYTSETQEETETTES